MTTVEILREARALIDTPDKWAQGQIGYALDGSPIGHAHELDDGIMGVSYCAFGAIRAVVRERDAAMPPSDALSHVVAGIPFRQGKWEPINWNNAPERTHAEVLAAFDRAIAVEEAKAAEFTVTPERETVPA